MKIFRWLVSVLIFLLAIYSFFKINFYLKIKKEYEILKNEVAQEIKKFPGEIGIYIKDLKTGHTIEYNENVKFPAASIIKIPIMAATFMAEKQGLINTQQIILLKNKYKVSGSGILKSKRPGTKLSIYELVELMIIESDNTATNILVDFLGFEYIDNFLKKENLKFTNFSRNIMDLTLRAKGIENYTTPKEIGLMLEKIYYGKLVDKVYSEKMLYILQHQQIKDRIPKLLPKSLEIANKTGFMRDVCHDVGIVFTEKGPFVICVFTKTKKYKFAKNLIANISLTTYNHYLD